MRVTHKGWGWKGLMLDTHEQWAWVLWDGTEIPQTALVADLSTGLVVKPPTKGPPCAGCGKVGCGCKGTVPFFGYADQ